VQFRLLFPGLMWFGAMILLFCTPLNQGCEKYFSCVPARSFVQCFMFLGFVHLGLGALNKQLRYEWIRRRSFVIMAIIAGLVAILSEVLMGALKISEGALWWNLLFDFIGIGLGIMTFRLLYRNCY